MIKKSMKILVVVEDPKTNKPNLLLEKVAFLAKKLKAAVELFTCSTDYELHETAAFDKETFEHEKTRYLQQQEEALGILAESLLKKKIEVTVDAKWQVPFHMGILDKALEVGADLIVKNVGQHDWLDEILLTNTDWQLIRISSIPLLFIKNNHWHEPPNIVAAVDPTHEHDKPAELDKSILSHATTLSQKMHADLKVLHASSINALALQYQNRINQYRKESLKELVDPFAIDGENVYLEDGFANSVIPGFVERENIDVVVMGAVSRSVVQTIFIGNTAEEVLNTIACDALVIK